MKAFCAIIFSCFFLLTTMQQTAFLLLYKLNEKSITEKYCVNKNIVGSCCHGKCHLNKTIAKSETENTKNPFSSMIVKVKEVEVFCCSLLDIVLHSEHPFTLYNYNYTAFLADGYISSLIKPPLVLG